MSVPKVEMVGIDILDAIELAEICSYLGAWIEGAPNAVIDSLVAFGGEPAKDVVLQELDHFGELLVHLVPSGSPSQVASDTPLSPGEASGLAELLSDLATYGWSDDPNHAETLTQDLRRWARRLAKTPSVMGSEPR